MGRRISTLLERRNHHVLRGVHYLRFPGDIGIDYRRDLDERVGLSRLAGVEGVINAVGILRESQRGDFQRIHVIAP